MADLAGGFLLSPWLIVIGFGCLWLGGQIVWVAPLPRQLRKPPVPSAQAGTPEAFGLFWIDQYGWIGLVLCGLGVLLLGVGVFA